MDLIIFFLVGLVVGLGLMIVVVKWKLAEIAQLAPESEQEKKKKENLKKLKIYLSDKEKITNQDVQDLLNVSDATATRYLDELEKSSIIKQVGKEGQSVYYEKS